METDIYLFIEVPYFPGRKTTCRNYLRLRARLGCVCGRGVGGLVSV